MQSSSHACVETQVSLIKANMVYGCKTMMMMMINRKLIEKNTEAVLGMF